MSNERPTRELAIENAVVVLYDYITGGDKRAIEQVFLQYAEMRQTASAGMEISGIKGSVTHEAENKAFERVVKEVRPASGEPITDRAKVLEFILDLPANDFEKVVAQVNEITDPKKA